MSDKPKRGRGRPRIYEGGYNASFAELGRRLALLGLTDEEMASVMGVSDAKLNAWKNEHPEFLDSLNEGKAYADAHVADRLLQRAMGYEHDEVDIRVVDKEIVQTKIRKFYPPDTAACIFWLKNRQREKWRDKVETGITDAQGKDVPIDPIEAAKRIAFALAQAGQLMDEQKVVH